MSFILCITQSLTAQTIGNNLVLPNILQPAPQSAALGRYGDIPVAINTGVPNISIPLCTLSSGKLSLPISISYHSSGVKVMDMASATGMGWALNAGADITRVVQGIADEGTYGFSTVRFPDVNDPSLLAKEKCLSNNICDNLGNGSNMWDGQPDIFYYNIGGRSGQFMEKNMISNTQPLSFMTVPYTPIQISTSTLFKTFKITDEDGTQYFFAACDSTTSSTNSSAMNTIYTTAWHVIKIRSANNADSIIFKYNVISNISYSTNWSRALQLIYNSFSNPVLWQYSTPSLSSMSTKEYLLSEIDFNNGKVTLDYGAGYAANQTMLLNAIHLYNLQNGTYNELKRFTFYHSAFMAGSTTTNVNRLDSLQISGYYNTSTPVKQPVYAFTYSSYQGWQVPPFNSFAQDFWGYFNGKTSNSDMLFVAQGADANNTPMIVSDAAKRIPDSNYLKVGTLQSIKYPTGGTTVFDLEPNQINTQVTNYTTVDHFVGLNASISNFGVLPNDASTFSYTFTADSYQAIYPNVGASTPNSNAKLTLEVSPSCRNGSTNCVSNQAYVYVNDITSGSPGAIVAELYVTSPTTTSTQTFQFNLTQGHIYKLNFPFQPIAPSSSSTFEYRLDASLQAQVSDSVVVAPLPPITETVLTGGLRIRKIISTDQFGHTLIKQYKYTGAYFNSPLFNGSFDQLALTSYAFDGWGKLSPPNSGNTSTTPQPAYTTPYGRVITSYTSNLPLPLGATSNNSVSYNEVEEYESDGLGNYNGKTVYDYNNKIQDIVTMQMPFYKVSKEDQRSLLTEKRTYKSLNGSYYLLQDIINNYTDLDSSMTNADTVVFYTAHALIDQGSLPETLGNLNGGAAWGCLGCAIFDRATLYLTNRYYYTTSRFVPRSTTQTTYDNNGNAVRTMTSYSYQNTQDAFATHTQTTNSAGKTIDNYTSYVLDQANPGGCTNDCQTNLTQQIVRVKQKYFPTFSSQFTIYSSDLSPMLNNYDQMGVVPADGPIYQSYSSATIAAENTYQQTQTNYQHAVDSLMNIYNSCGTSYNNCVTDYYNNSASADQKAILDMQSQNEITPHLEDSTYTNNVLMARTKINYLSYLPNVTMPATVQFATQTNTLENRLQYDKYDVHGNILQQRKAGGPPSSFQWGYNNTYPVASVTNATANDFFYESFEEGDGTSTLNDAKTGHYSSTIGFSKTLNGLDNGNYKLSYWQWNGSIWLLQTSAVTVSNGSYTINVTGKVDDIRFYPSSAQMTTYTYDPLVGMTSSTDAKGETTYYEYDGLQRLMNSRDKDGNIVKHMDYHYQGQ